MANNKKNRNRKKGVRGKQKPAAVPEKAKIPQVPSGWLYLSDQEFTLESVREMLHDAYEMEYWQEAGVLEIQLEESSLDFEEADMSRADEITQEYLAKKGAETVFLVTISPLDYEAAEAAMKDLSGRLGGFFCGDTADFTPVLP